MFQTGYFFAVALVMLVALLWYVRRVHTVEDEPFRSILNLAEIPSLRQAMPELNLEISRARRLSHDLSIVVVRAEFVADERQSRSTNIRNFTGNQSQLSQSQLGLQEFSDCSRAFRDLLREVDHVVFDSVRDQFVVILPGSTRSQAMETINRISKHLGPAIANRLVVGIAEYPGDGLFLDDLIEAGMAHVNSASQDNDFKFEVRA